MSRDRLFDTTLVISAVTLAALAGVVLFVALVFVGRPPAYAARLAQLNATTARIEALEKAPAPATTYGAKAVCTEATATAADSLRRTLLASASRSSVSMSNVVTTPGEADETAGGLAPVTLRFEATGQYDAVIGLLGQMGRWQPELFVDSLNLRSQVSSVVLKLEGRVYCSTSARR